MNKFIQNVAIKSGFDPATIIAIITAIVNAISQCQKPSPTPVKIDATFLKNEAETFRGTYFIHTGLRSEDIRPRSEMGRKIASAIREEMAATSDENLSEFVSLVQ